MTEVVKTNLERQFIYWCAQENNLPDAYIPFFGEAEKSKPNFENLKQAYAGSFGVNNLFDVELNKIEKAIRETEQNCSRKRITQNQSFEVYNKEIGNTIPYTLLVKYYTTFLMSLKLIRMSSDEFILYIRKNYPYYEIKENQLISKIWEWLEARGAKQITKQQVKQWGEETDEADAEQQPYKASQFQFDRALLPDLYTYIDLICL